MFGRMLGSLFSPQADVDGRVHVVAPDEIRRWHDAGEALLIDVREVGEHAAERIKGALNLPLSVFDPSRVPHNAGKKLVIHCRSGQRCGLAAARLISAGFEGEIHRMQGGLMGWKAAGGPVAAG